MTGLAIFRVAAAASVSSLASFDESLLRPCGTPSEWQAVLAPFLPNGTQWVDAFNARWRSSTNELEVTLEADLSSLAVEARDVAEGPVFEMLERMRDAGTWVVVSLNRAEVFDYASPETN